jgi:DUF1009 family protein
VAGQGQTRQDLLGHHPRLHAAVVLTKLRGPQYDALISAVAEVLKGEGIELLNSTAFLEPLLAKSGTLGGRQPTAEELDDIAFGYRMADAVAALDIGQAIVVKDKAVVAVEAMEGTDVVIRRAGEIAGPGTRIVKVAKPNQDMRFDVPVVGVATIEAMKAAGRDRDLDRRGQDADRGRERFFEAANAAGIVVVGGRAPAGECRWLIRACASR